MDRHIHPSSSRVSSLARHACRRVFADQALRSRTRLPFIQVRVMSLLA
jgi:hypothetical protein